MKPKIEIRSIRIGDLRDVFILGNELIGTSGPRTAASWTEKNLADVIADNLELSFAAVFKKTIIGFIIGALWNDGTASILWLCARRLEQADVSGALLNELHQCLIEKNINTIRAEVADSNAELVEFYRKFGFTETEHVLIMENFLSKNKKAVTQEV